MSECHCRYIIEPCIGTHRPEQSVVPLYRFLRTPEEGSDWVELVLGHQGLHRLLRLRPFPSDVDSVSLSFEIILCDDLKGGTVHPRMIEEVDHASFDVVLAFHDHLREEGIITDCELRCVQGFNSCRI